MHIRLEMKWEYIKWVEAVHPSHRQARVLAMFLPFYTLETHMVYHDAFPNFHARILVDVLLLSRNIDKVIVTLDVATLIAAATILRFLGCCIIYSAQNDTIWTHSTHIIHPLGRPLFFGALNFIAPWSYRNTHDSLLLSPASGASEKMTSLGI
jgi:hypothetical protein